MSPVDYDKLAGELGGTAEADASQSQSGIDPRTIATIGGGLAGAGALGYGGYRAATSPVGQRLGRAIVRGAPVIGPIAKEMERTSPNPRGGGAKMVKLSKAEVEGFEQFRNFKPGQEVSRSFYERTLSKATPIANPRIVAQQEARVEATQGMKPRTRGGRIVGGPSEIPTRPIKVDGEPKVAPAQTTNPRYTGGRGASGPELARRAADRQAFLEGRPPYGPRPQLSAEEAAALRTAPVADPELWMKRGISAPPGKFTGLRGIAPGALQVLLTLLDAQSMPQQIDQSSQLFQDEILKTNPYAQGYREGKYFTRRGGI